MRLDTGTHSIHLSSHGSQSCCTRRSTCQSVPFGKWLQILGQIKTQRQTLSIWRLICNLEDHLAPGRLSKLAVEGLMWDLLKSKRTMWWLFWTAVFTLISLMDPRMCGFQRCKLIFVFNWLLIVLAGSGASRYFSRLPQSMCKKWGKWEFDSQFCLSLHYENTLLWCSFTDPSVVLAAQVVQWVIWEGRDNLHLLT